MGARVMSVSPVTQADLAHGMALGRESPVRFPRVRVSLRMPGDWKWGPLRLGLTNEDYAEATLSSAVAPIQFQGVPAGFFDVEGAGARGTT